MDKDLVLKTRGAYALMLTPFNEDLSVNYAAYENYVQWQAEKCKNLFAVCGSSEMAQLTLDERLKLAELTVKNKGDNFIVATANLEPSWFAQVEEVKKMEATGVDGLVFITKGFGNDDDRVVTYLSELADHTTLPVLLYEFPGAQPHKISGDAYGRLVQTGKFYGIKDTTCTMEKIKDKIAVQGDSNVLQANIPLLFDSYVAGARGVMATPTTCGSHLFQRMWDEFSSGNVEAARKTHQEIILLDCAIDSGFNVSAKYLVNLQGCQFNAISRSGVRLSEARMRSLEVFYDYAKANGILF